MRVLATVFFAVTCVAVITQAAYVSEREAAAIAVEELINEHLHDDPADFEDFANERITFPDSDESFVHKDVDPGLDEDQLSSEEHDKLRESLLQFTDLETMHAHILKGYEKHERAEAAAKAANADEEALRAAEDDETPAPAPAPEELSFPELSDDEEVKGAQITAIITGASRTRTDRRDGRLGRYPSGRRGA